MNIKYHPNTETLLHYAAGNLSNAFANTVEVHTKFCTGCSHQVSEFEQLGGSVLDTLPNTSVTTSFNQLMDKLFTQANTPTISKDPVNVIDHVMQYAKLHPEHKQLQASKWVNITRGISDQKLDVADKQYRSRLIRIKAGTKIPAHTHHGEEITVVLKGSFSDGYGQYNAGDFLVRDGAYEHSPYADSDCICLAITDASLHYTGFFGPVINWFNNRFERKHYGYSL